MQTAEQPKSRVRSVLREVVETVVFTFLIYALVRTFLFENYRVVGRSMLPTLENDQFLVVNKLGYRLEEPQRGDIIVFRDPRDSDRKLIKRVIGLPGETVEVNTGQVIINGQVLQEPYIESTTRYSQPSRPIPQGQYFVLGDNRNNSSDSHNWGTLSEDKIVGKAWISYWPPRLWGIIPHQIYGDIPFPSEEEP
ncbi:MAG: signal peptidase I [Anaerolineae bacterium]|jgi:signal peptidase I